MPRHNTIHSARLDGASRLPFVTLLFVTSCLFLTFAFTVTGANVRLYFLDRYTGNVDTNYFIVTPISGNILASGGVVPNGLPIRVTPRTNGYATNFLSQGFYAVTNRFLNFANGIVINVQDQGAQLYDYTNLLHSGFNTYVYGGSGGSATNVTQSAVTNALGYSPQIAAPWLTNISATGAITNVAAGTNAEVHVASGIATVSGEVSKEYVTNTVNALGTNIAKGESLTVSNGLSARLIATNNIIRSDFTNTIAQATNDFRISVTNIAKAESLTVSNGLSARLIATNDIIRSDFTNTIAQATNDFRITATNIAKGEGITVSNGLSARIIATNNLIRTELTNTITQATNDFRVAATNIAKFESLTVSNGLSARLIATNDRIRLDFTNTIAQATNNFRVTVTNIANYISLQQTNAGIRTNADAYYVGDGWTLIGPGGEGFQLVGGTTFLSGSSNYIIGDIFLYSSGKYIGVGAGLYDIPLSAITNANHLTNWARVATNLMASKIDVTNAITSIGGNATNAIPLLNGTGTNTTLTNFIVLTGTNASAINLVGSNLHARVLIVSNSASFAGAAAGITADGFFHSKSPTSLNGSANFMAGSSNYNYANSDYNFISGLSNQVGAASDNNAISGQQNIIGVDTSVAQASWNFIAGGFGSVISNSAGYNGILHGFSNAIGQSVTYSLAGGRRAKSVHAGAVTLSDSANADFNSSAADTFNTRFNGGFTLTGGTFSVVAPSMNTATNLGWGGFNSAPAFPILNYSTNVVAFWGGATNGSDNFYVWNGSAYTNYSANTWYLTNIASVWHLKDAGGIIMYSSTSLTNAAWTLVNVPGGSAAPKSTFTGYIYLNGAPIAGKLIGTNITGTHFGDGFGMTNILGTNVNIIFGAGLEATTNAGVVTVKTNGQTTAGAGAGLSDRYWNTNSVFANSIQTTNSVLISNSIVEYTTPTLTLDSIDDSQNRQEWKTGGKKIAVIDASGVLQVGGYISQGGVVGGQRVVATSVQVRTTNSFLSATNYTIIASNTTGADLYMRLPQGSTVVAGQPYTIMQATNASCIITGFNSGDLINGRITNTIYGTNDLLTFIWSGSQWRITDAPNWTGNQNIGLFDVATNAIPAGWALCDGSAAVNSVGEGITLPDYGAMFPYGAKIGTQNTGETGGSATHSHSVSLQLDAGSNIAAPGGGNYDETINGGTANASSLPPYRVTAYLYNLRKK